MVVLAWLALLMGVILLSRAPFWKYLGHLEGK